MNRETFMIDEVAGDTFVARLLGSDGDEAYEIHAVYTGRGRLVPDGTFHSAGEQKEWELEDVEVIESAQLGPGILPMARVSLTPPISAP